MIATVVTFITERIVAVVVTTVVVVVAVPATIIVTSHGNTVTITNVASSSRQHEDERTRVINDVDSEASAVIVKMDDEQGSCDAQIVQLAAQSKLPADATATVLRTGRQEFDGTVEPFVAQIKADEEELGHLKVVTAQTEQTFLLRIHEIEVVALGGGGRPGEIVTVCQTVLIEVQQVIVVVVQPAPAPSGGEDEADDLKFAA